MERTWRRRRRRRRAKEEFFQCLHSDRRQSNGFLSSVSSLSVPFSFSYGAYSFRSMRLSTKVYTRIERKRENKTKRERGRERRRAPLVCLSSSFFLLPNKKKVREKKRRRRRRRHLQSLHVFFFFRERKKDFLCFGFIPSGKALLNFPRFSDAYRTSRKRLSLFL